MNVRAVAAAVAATVFSLSACGDGGSADGPGLTPIEVDGSATYEYTIPLGAGEALDAGEPLEVLPGELNTRVGESIRIVNDDDRGHNVGPWFVGANETLNQEFTSAGSFEGVCTVHPSGELILNVEA